MRPGPEKTARPSLPALSWRSTAHSQYVYVHALLARLRSKLDEKPGEVIDVPDARTFTSTQFRTSERMRITTPVERTRALRAASELLRDPLQRQDVPADLRVRARGVLHHHPEEWQLRMMAEDWQHLGNSTFGLEPEPERPDPQNQLLAFKLSQG